MVEMDLVDKIKELIVHEGKSCTMDICGITPLYMYRMWGGTFSIEDIENVLTEIRNEGFYEIRSSGCPLTISGLCMSDDVFK